MNPLNLSESGETGKPSPLLNDVSEGQNKSEPAKSPINYADSDLNIKQDQYKTTSSSLDDVLPQEKVKDAEPSQTPINLNVSLDIDPSKLIKLDNSGVTQVSQTVNNTQTKESSTATINTDTSEKSEAFFTQKYFQLILENFEKEKKDILNDREKILNAFESQKEVINQSSINQKELRETSEKLVEASKNIENTSNINLSTLKEVNSPSTNTSSNSINKTENTINISDTTKKSEEYNNTNLEKSQNIKNITDSSNLVERNSNNQLEVIKTKELISAEVAPLSEKQLPQVVEKTKEPSSEITLTQVTEKVHEVARQKLEDENRRLTSEAKPPSTESQEKSQPNIIIDMSEVSNRLSRIERLLSGQLEVKIVQ